MELERLHRRTNNRHAPPDAMLNHFWNRIPGFSPQTRPKPITPKNELVTHPGAVLTGKVGYGKRLRSLPSGEVAAVGLLVPDLGPGWLHRGAGTRLEQQRAHLACSRSGRVVALGGRHD
jgi:hypothetical protein